MKEKIRILIQLQDCDNKITQIMRLIDQGPLKIQDLMNGLIASEAEFQSEYDKLELLKKERRKIEQEVQDLDNGIQKSSVKLSNIKSNKEYTAAIKEIEDLKKIKVTTEDRVIQIMEEMEATEKRFQKNKKKEPELKSHITKQKEEIEKQLIGLKKELDSLEMRKNGLLKIIDGDILKRYLFLKERKGGQAISAVIVGVCQTCHIGIPPQKFNELIRGNALMTCPHCNRIIYWGEDAHFQTQTPLV